MAAGGMKRTSPVWWGISPALDLQMHVPPNSTDHLSSYDDLPEMNILLVGVGDCRHLLKTICQASRWPRKKLNFFIIERDLELLARHMLFLTLALENPKQMGLQEKSELFLELFGNSLIRNKTFTYLQEKCELFIQFVTDPDYQQSIIPSLNLSSIKFKERDELEAIFKFWRMPDPNLFPIERYWDFKNREYLGRQYDSRKGAYDWDLSMKLHDRGAGVIHSNEYNHWREKGVAFMIREGIYDVPNKTLASHMIVPHRGAVVRTQGYYGDITTSPYIAYGIETEKKTLLKTANGVHIKTAQEISQYNVVSMFHELVTGQKYLVPGDDKAETEPIKPSNYYIVNKGEEGMEESENSNQPETSSFIPLDNVEIHFLPFSWVNELHHKNKFTNFFHLFYFSCSMVHFLNPEYKLIAASKATLILELTKFMVTLQAEKLKSYIDIITKVAHEAGFTSAKPNDWQKDPIATFQRVDDSVDLKNGDVEPQAD
ncbi:hypothetical protein GDO86_012473 [Hymenochirus boettgeri]|uniref:Dynein axonemal assembly factor 3 n=1 Tax=Hymenochirus boettgeri TaxID=247094 RepID=A0A8T2IUI7_9PIPI|nr:hypothetical protein GDO86_012473 [Hymenochirus boettgeri]